MCKVSHSMPQSRQTQLILFCTVDFVTRGMLLHTEGRSRGMSWHGSGTQAYGVHQTAAAAAAALTHLDTTNGLLFVTVVSALTVACVMPVPYRLCTSYSDQPLE
jgi:hypothetical protein